MTYFVRVNGNTLHNDPGKPQYYVPGEPPKYPKTDFNAIDFCLKRNIVRIGWPDQFIEHGSINILREKHGITAAAALEKIRPFLKKQIGTKQPRPAA